MSAVEYCEYCDLPVGNIIVEKNNKIYCSNTCLQAKEFYFDRYDRKYENIIQLVKQYSPPSIIDENVTEEEERDEADWLHTCRRSRCYIGPVGGPPGLDNDRYPDPAKAVHFRRLCEYYRTTYPELIQEKTDKRTEPKLIDDDLIYSLANDYLQLEEYFIKQVLHKVKIYVKERADTVTEEDAIEKAGEFFTEYIKLIIKSGWNEFESLKELRIYAVAKGLNEEDIRDIVDRQKEHINWLKIK